MAMKVELTERELGYLVTTSEGVYALPLSVTGERTMPTSKLDDAVRPYVVGSILEVRTIGPCYFGRLINEGTIDLGEWVADENLFRLQDRLLGGDVL